MARKKRRLYEDTKVVRAEFGSRLPGVIIGGIAYDSAAEAASDWNVSTMAISTWINGQVKGGIYYPPFDKCRPQFVNVDHRHAWQRRVTSQKKKYRKPPGFPPAVVIDGFIYPSVYHAAMEFDVTPETIRNWCRANTRANCWYTPKQEYERAA